MKAAANTKSFLFLVLFSMAGAHAAWASDSVDDAQQQARSLLGGRNVSVSGVASRSAVETSAASASIPVDAQEQGRQMILGRPFSRIPRVPAVARARNAKTESDSRKGERGGDELARRMILRSAS
jgi:hypothetical protein